MGDDPVSRIATAADVPHKFLELILADLREAGFLHSHRGKMSGYCLARPRHLISLGEIIRAIEGRLVFVLRISEATLWYCRYYGDTCNNPLSLARHRPRR